MSAWNKAFIHSNFVCFLFAEMSQQGGSHSTPAMQPGQPSRADNLEERLVILKMSREQRPLTRDGIVDALFRYGYLDFEAVGRFSRGLEFQVLREKEADAEHMSSKGFLEVKNARGIISGCVMRKFTQCEVKVRVGWLPAVVTEEEVGELFVKYGHFLKVYKEIAPQVRGHPRYWGTLL